MTSDDQDFAAKLRAARLGKGWSQADLCRESKVDPSTISRYETRKNTNPEWETVVKLAGALGLEPHDLVAVRPPALESRVEPAEGTLRADWALIDEVAEEVGLSDEIVDRLRRVNWTGGVAPSRETLRAYGLDMKRDGRERAAGREPPAEPKKPSKLTPREPRRGGGRR